MSCALQKSKGKMGIREKIRENIFQGMRKALKPLWFQGFLVEYHNNLDHRD